MKYEIFHLLREKNIDPRDISLDTLYKAGLKNVKDNIEFYYDKTYTCESVIKELFIRGIKEYINKH